MPRAKRASENLSQLPLRARHPLVALLPPHLAERARVLPAIDRASRPAAAGSAGEPFSEPPAAEYVLCWLRCALRAEENPALDAALLLARAKGLPALVYLGLSERSPYASDRLHAFQLEAMRELAGSLRARGIPVVVHVERPGHREPVLKQLAQRAAAVVLDEVPLGFLQTWAERLALACSPPVLTVDAACVVPMEVVGRAHDRAFAYRDATAAERRARISASWPELPETAPTPALTSSSTPPALPFEPVDLGALDDAGLAALIATCEIDHSVPPVPETRGGSSAGYARWNAFRERGLARYARDRNDPLLPGVSRMSAYLHFGCVSPLRLAREAAAQKGPGAEKFLDELLIWRELAWSFCRFTPGAETLAAVPAWARRTLEEHASDPRPLRSWEQLSSAQSGDALWDACQRSLLRHGELHNNLRMTWGKALVGWTRDAAAALEMLVELNHRYALDGRDPASLGGILWCLGQFDRPFSPELPVLGSVRPRPLSGHASRLEVRAYQAQVSRPARTGPKRVAVIGAGIAGLACARALVDQGVEVTLFDKGRGPGGRLATRRAEGFSFDHGAQFFTARDPGFSRRVRSWVEQGVAAPWTPREVEISLGPAGRAVRAREHQHPRYVAQPGMASLARHLAQGLDLRQGVRVTGAAREAGGSFLTCESEVAAGATSREGPFDAVAIALPAPQAAPLVKALAPALLGEVERATFTSCHALLVGLDGPAGVQFGGVSGAVSGGGFDAATIEGSPLAWVARAASKPGRGAAEAWVAHASAAWSEAHLERPVTEVATLLSTALEEVLGAKLPAPRHLVAHRWRYALASAPLERGCLFDAGAQVGACGDWCKGPRVEGAWLSGVALAGRLLGG